MASLIAAIDARAARAGAAMFSAATQQVSTSAVRMVGSLSRVSSSMQTVGTHAAALRRTVAGLFVGITVVRLVRDLVGVNTAFEQTMATIQAISRDSVQNLERMREAAIQTGATTRFSANQAAEGLLVLSRAGFTTSQSIEALKPALDLALVGAVGFNSAADALVSTIFQFHLAVTDSSKIVDVLTAATNRTNIEIEEMIESMKFAGPVAHATGTSLEETAASIGVLGQAGLKGSLAGTKLRGVLFGLASPTRQARDALAEMGLTLDEVNPVKVGVVSAMEKLAGANMNASQALRIFNRLNAGGGIALTQNVDLLRELVVQLSASADESKTAAAIIDNTLQGAMKRLSNAFDLAYISVGDSGFLGALRRLVDTSTGTILILAGLEKSVTSNLQSARYFAEVIRLLGIAISLYLIQRMILATSTMFTAAGAARTLTVSVGALNVALTASPLALFAIGLTAIGAAFLAIRPHISGTTDALKEFSSLRAVGDELEVIRAGGDRARVSKDLEGEIRALESEVATIDRVLNELAAARAKSIAGATESGYASPRGHSIPAMDVLKTVPEMESTLRKSFGDEDGSLLKSTIGATKVEELFERAIASRRSAIDELKKKLEGSPDGSLSSLMNEAEIEALLKATEALQEYADKQAQAFELVEMTDSAKKKLLETEELNKLLTEARIPLDSAQAAQLRTSIGLLIDYEDEVEAANKALEEGIRAREGVVQAQVAASQTVRDQIDLLNEEAYLMGLSANQREIESRVLQAQSSYREVGTVLMSEEADELRSLGAELIRVREAQEEVNQELGKAQALQQANRDLVTQAIEGAQRLERRARLEILTLNLTNEAKERALVLDGLREASGDADSPELENALANLDRQLERLDTLEQLKEVADGIGEAFGQAFEKVILGTGSVRDAVKAMLQDIMQQLLRTLVTQQIVQGISSGISGLGGGGTGAGKPKVLAMGGVLSRGNIVPFASGGVVGSPMFFPLQGGKTGLMGEAGPEAIMPLSRGPGGKLGVRAEGGRSVVVNMTVNARDAKSFIQSKRQIGTMLRRMGDA